MPEHSLYFFINFFSLLFPLAFSFYGKNPYYKSWSGLFQGMAAMAVIFIPWDIWFTSMGVWGFNSDYISQFHIFNLPIEELIFFFCIPYSSIFIFHTMKTYAPGIKLGRNYSLTITILLALTLTSLALLNFEKLYTLFSFSLTSILLVFILLFSPLTLQYFYPSFLIILIPFFIVNGVLTGTGIPQEVVWYNNNHNLGIRLFTIPIEDSMYALSMLLICAVIMEKVNQLEYKTNRATLN